MSKRQSRAKGKKVGAPRGPAVEPIAELPAYHCLRCGREWTPRKSGPVLRCGRCRSPYWNQAPKRRSR